jgi:Uma2 family endonuclease
MVSKASVPEYWIVDPQSETIEQWVLDFQSNYHALGLHHESISISTIPNVNINLMAIWDK